MKILYESCPLCNSRNFAFLKSANALQHPLYSPPLPDSIRWMHCTECSHVFTDGFWDSEGLEILFQKTHEIQDVRKANQEVLRVVNARVVQSLISEGINGVRLRLPSKSNGPTWLDVGFGSGSLLFTAEEFGYDVSGIDLRAQNVIDACEMDLDATCCSIEEFAGLHPDYFNIVSLADVLEHVPFPKTMLRAANDLLKQGGLLFVSCPNSDTVVWKALDMVNQNPYWFEIEHHHCFSRHRIYSLLEECGFEVLKYGVSERYRSAMEIICRVN